MKTFIILLLTLIALPVMADHNCRQYDNHHHCKPAPPPTPPPVPPPVPPPIPPVPPLVCAQPPTSTLVVNVKDMGALGDGKTNDTASIQAAINKVGGTGGEVLVPDGTYMIDALTSVNLKSNMTFSMTANAILKTIPNNKELFALLAVEDVSNVNIIGGTLQGDRINHLGTTGEWGMNLWIDGATNIVIEKVTSINAWGDGFYNGEDFYQSKNITLCSVVADNNRRQGFSIENVDGMVIKNSTFKNTSGTNPSDGIDIEPNHNNTVTNVQILNSIFTGNANHGLELISMFGQVSNITLTGNNFSGNKNTGTYFYPGIKPILSGNTGL